MGFQRGANCQQIMQISQRFPCHRLGHWRPLGSQRLNKPRRYLKILKTIETFNNRRRANLSKPAQASARPHPTRQRLAGTTFFEDIRMIRPTVGQARPRLDGRELEHLFRDGHCSLKLANFALRSHVTPFTLLNLLAYARGQSMVSIQRESAPVRSQSPVICVTSQILFGLLLRERSLLALLGATCVCQKSTRKWRPICVRLLQYTGRRMEKV